MFKINNRFNLAVLLIFIFIFVSFITRTILLLKSISLVDIGPMDFIQLYLTGLFYDTVASLYYISPFVIYLALIPQKVFNSSIHKKIMYGVVFVQTYILIFNGFSEWFFWDEFGKRFNFIAVDYLVYTHEVINNILESYPIPLLLSVIFVLTTGIFMLLKKYNLIENSFKEDITFSSRIKIATGLIVTLVFFFNILNEQSLSKISKNQYNNELAKDGFYSLFSAFRNNTLDYDEFYATNDIKTVFKQLKKEVGFDDKTKLSVIKQGKEKRYNVMLVMVESLSAEYMGIYGDKRGLTKHLDNLTKKSLFFNNLYATGTRTVRGMEAVTLSVPPTPGRSIVKRPDNHNMLSVGFMFKDRGYESKFIYAGHGYFDNMNDYFSNNGFDIVDRLSFKDDEITFSNVWGVCDEDLFNKAIKEADNSYKDKKPFFNFIMTTSNHRPYTYPDGKIDIPSHEGRDGGVKYTDFSINEFLENASKKPWFKDTIFIIIADHNGGSAGKQDLPLYRYKIPFIVYAPSIIKPQTVTKLASQIDAMPTLFSLMNWSYESKMYGKDILDKNFKQRALIGTYQKLGLVKDDKITILSPDKSVKTFKIIDKKLRSTKYKEMPTSKSQRDEAIMYFQSASYLYKHRLNRNE